MVLDTYESAEKDISKTKEKSDLGTAVSDIDNGTTLRKRKRTRYAIIKLSHNNIILGYQDYLCFDNN